MKLDSVIAPPDALASGRFFRTGYLPTYVAALYLLVLVWAGAPGQRVNFSQAWRTAEHLGGVQVLLVAVAVAGIAVLAQPLQLALVRAFEGGFPQWLGSGLIRRVQLARKRSLEGKIQARVDAAVRQSASADQGQPLVQEAGAMSERLRSRFPAPEYLVRGTALGNALAAVEDTAGAAYGLDAAVMWPRLYPLLEGQVRAAVDDLRDGLDAAVRLSATATLSVVATVVLLAWHSGWLNLLALIPLTVASLAYVGAVQAAVAYGSAVRVAFDLHRFDLLRALHLAIPAERDAEYEANVALSDFIRQGVPLPFGYAASELILRGGGGD